MQAEIQPVPGSEYRARKMFMDNPGMSIDEAARQLANEHQGLAKDRLSRIRQDVRAQIDRGFQKPAGAGVMIRRQGHLVGFQPVRARSPEVFNPPRLVLSTAHAVPDPLARMPGPVPDSLAKLATQPMAQKPPETTPTPAFKPDPPKAERLKFLEDWVLDHPTASVNKARQALLERFGMTISTTVINTTLKQARELYLAEHPEKQESGVGAVRKSANRTDKELESITDLIRAMKQLRVKSLEVVGNHYLVEMVD